jgi:hypothetical protein
MSASSVPTSAQVLPQPKVSSGLIESGSDCDRDPPSRNSLDERLAGWFVVFLLLMVTVTVLGVIWNRFGHGLHHGHDNESQHENILSQTAASIPVDSRDLLDDAQREKPRGSNNPVNPRGKPGAGALGL